MKKKYILCFLFFMSLFLLHFSIFGFIEGIIIDWWERPDIKRIMLYCVGPRQISNWIDGFFMNRRLRAIVSLIETLLMYVLHGIGIKGAVQQNRREILISAWVILCYRIAIAICWSVSSSVHLHRLYLDHSSVVSEIAIELIMVLIILLARNRSSKIQ